MTKYIENLLAELLKELLKLDNETYVFFYNISSDDLDIELSVGVYKEFIYKDFSHSSDGDYIYDTEKVFHFNGYITEENKEKIQSITNKVKELNS